MPTTEQNQISEFYDAVRAGCYASILTMNPDGTMSPKATTPEDAYATHLELERSPDWRLRSFDVVRSPRTGELENKRVYNSVTTPGLHKIITQAPAGL